MQFLSQIDFLYFSREYLKAAVLVCLLSVWVLVALFYYLNHYTKRRYFTIWTAAWLFYALWITLTFGMGGEKTRPLLLMFQQWCVGVAAVFLFWGSQRFLGERVPQRLIGWFLAFLLVCSYTGAFYLDHPLEMEVPLFGLIGGASLFTAWSFFKYRRKRGYVGATLLTVGFTLWGIYMISYPFLDSKDLISIALFISAVIQLLVAVSMIILVLEEVRSTQQTAVERIHTGNVERDALQTKVASTEERYRSLFEHAGEAIVITSTDDFRILELNHAAQRLLGITQAEASRQLLSAFCQTKLSGAASPRSSEEWFESIRRERPLNLTRKNGEAVPAEVDGTKIDFGGRPGYQFFLREITERARLEQQLRQAEKLSALGQMISGVAHELNNPLAVVRGYLELILTHHDLQPQTRTDLEKAARESERAAKLVRNFLSFAREGPVHRKKINFNELIQRVAELRKADFNRAGVELALDLAPGLPDVLANPDQIQQVLINLIDNALHAVAGMPKRGKLKIRTQQKDEHAHIAVEDSGPGVPAELETKIFEPFFTTKPVGTGTGLGLSIAHSIMTEHKGRIFSHRSSLGGACFVLEFPLTEPDTETLPAEESGFFSKPAAPPKHFGNILVLDDEKALAEMLGEMLDILGHKTLLSHSAGRALELIETHSFDVIISDFRMPGLDGRQFYELAKQKQPELAQRIIFLTGDVVNEETQAFIRSTGNPHLEKPFNLTKIRQAVDEVLAKTAAARVFGSC